MTDRYKKNIAVKGIVLRELRDVGHTTGEELLKKIDAACAIAQRNDAEFDFVFWAGATYWELLGFLSRCSMLAHDGKPPMGVHEWRRARLTVTEHGLKFLRAVEREAGDKLAIFKET